MLSNSARCIVAAIFALSSSAVFAAGNISVIYSRGDVLVTGDSRSNDIQVTRSYGNQHLFTGLNGTTINGSTRAIVLPIYDDLRINLGDGNDFLDIRSLRATSSGHADLVVQMGNGNDEFALHDAYVARKVTIDSDLAGSFGNDHVDIENLRSADLVSIDLFNGLDAVRVSQSDIALQLIVTALENADITIHLTDVPDLDINSGFAGADSVRILGNDTDRIALSTSEEDDDVTFLMNKIRDSRGYAYTFDGDDLIDFRMNDLGEWGSRDYYFVINGGAGFDDGSVIRGFLAPVIVQAFEGTLK